MGRPSTLTEVAPNGSGTCGGGAEEGVVLWGSTHPVCPEAAPRWSTLSTGCRPLNFSPGIHLGWKDGRCLRTVPSLLSDDLKPIS